jgi:hypothetical protein
MQLKLRVIEIASRMQQRYKYCDRTRCRMLVIIFILVNYIHVRELVFIYHLQ